MTRSLSVLACVLVLVATTASAGTISAVESDWHGFVIRDTTTSGDPAVISVAAGVVTAQTFQGGQKVGYGTSVVDGLSLGDITRYQVTRLDDAANAYAPYVNMWVTDGAGHFAILALEPSNYPALDWTHDLDQAEFRSISPWVYETDRSDVSWMLPGAYASSQYLYGSGGTLLTIGDLTHLTILSPTAYDGFVGSGAPKAGYGFNIVFGDTQANYVGGYRIGSAPVLQAEVVPEPGTLVLLLSGGLLVLRRRRR